MSTDVAVESQTAQEVDQDIEVGQPENITNDDQELEAQSNQDTQLENNSGQQNSSDIWSDSKIYNLAVAMEKDPDFVMTPEQEQAFEDWTANGGELDPEKIQKLLENPDSLEDLEEQATDNENQAKDDAKGSFSEADLKATMEELGAKDPSQIPELIKGLKASRDKTGSKLGNENKQLREQLEAQNRFVQDLAMGKPEAIKWAKENGIEVGNRNFTESETDYDDELMDPVAERKINELKSIIDELKSEREQERSTLEAKNSRNQMDLELTKLWKDFPEIAPSGNIKDDLKLFDDYKRGNDGDEYDSRLDKTFDLLRFADERGIKNLDDAYFLMNKNSISQKIIEAEERGRNSVLDRAKRTTGLANQRNSGTPSQFSINDIIAMENGDMEMPDNWLDDNYQPTRHMPKVARERYLKQR